MTSLLTNASAITALQSLTMTQHELKQTQTQISTGLKVSSAADNAAYWSIATQMRSDNGVLGAVKDSLGESSSILDVASSALNSVISTIDNIKNDLAAADNPGADLNSINADLQQQSAALKSAINGASFNGVNLLNGTQSNGAATGSLDFVSGFQQVSNSSPPPDTLANIDTIKLTVQALTTTSAGGMLNTASGAAAFSTTYDLTMLGTTSGTNAHKVSASNAADMMVAADNALKDVTSYASSIGSTQALITQQTNFVSSLSDALTNGVSSLVDADMNQASTKLQALQVQQQLGIQSLSIANQNTQLILKLFGG